jgi:hypothetical protein
MLLNLLISCISLIVFPGLEGSIVNLGLFGRVGLSLSFDLGRIEVSSCDEEDVLDLG